MNNEVFLDALAITVILVSPGMFAQGLWVTSGKPFLPYLSSYFTARAYVKDRIAWRSLHRLSSRPCGLIALRAQRFVLDGHGSPRSCCLYSPGVSKDDLPVESWTGRPFATFLLFTRSGDIIGSSVCPVAWSDDA